MIATINSKEGHVDVDMAVAFVEELPGGTKVTAAGSYEDDLIGFCIEVPPDWEIFPGQGGRPSIFRGKIARSSVGAPSDGFVRRLAEAYGSSTRVEGMKDRVVFTATSFGGDPRHLKSAPILFKIFHKTEEAPDLTVAEYFLGIDVELGKVTFHEKDSEYRDAMLKALSA
jgi:hypothetical protein